MRTDKQTMELSRQDGKIWCRDINAPRSVPWRPVFANTYTEAARELRDQGYRVTRRRSGL